MNCPNCKREINLKKHALQTCRCGAQLLIAVVNGKHELHDLTPKEAEKINVRD